MKPRQVVAENRRARFDVAIEQTYEAGLVLHGDEIKSIRAKRAQLNGAYVKIMGKNSHLKTPSVSLIGLHLSQAKDPERSRDLLLHQKEVAEIVRLLEAKGKVAVPLELHLLRGWAKITLGVGMGRKQRDKRELLKSRDLDRAQADEIKKRR